MYLSDKSNLHRSHCGTSERDGIILKIGKGNCECLEGTWTASKHPLVTVGCLKASTSKQVCDKQKEISLTNLYTSTQCLEHFIIYTTLQNFNGQYFFDDEKCFVFPSPRLLFFFFL